MELSRHASAYFEAVTAADGARATDLVLHLLEEGVGLDRISGEVLGPAQVRVGQLWEQGRWTAADEHAATGVTEAALAALVHAGRPAREPEARHVLLACAEGEWHALPARLAAAVATAGDVRVTVLAPSVPAEQLGRRLDAGDVDLLALSCTMTANLLGAARCVQAAHERGVPVLAGGQAFGDGGSRARAVGADGWSADAGDVTRVVPLRRGGTAPLPGEALLLEALHAAQVDVVSARLLAQFPALRRTDPQDLAASLRGTARCAAAALLTGEPGVLDDHLAWAARPHGTWGSAEVTGTAVHLLAEAVEADGPDGAALLHAAADRLTGTAAPLTGR